jgi:hypothetical protein
LIVKKAEMSINLIVVAAIALLILVILAVLVARKLGWLDVMTRCGGAGNGICADDCAAFEDGTYTSEGTGPNIGCKESQSCCIKISSSGIAE